MPDLQFTEADHSYTLDGVRLPSVTQVIDRVLPRAFEASEWHKQRGAVLHRCTELADAGRLKWDTVHPEVLPRVKAWQKFRRDCPGVIAMNERKLHHPLYHYAGTMDRAIFFETELFIVDLKSSVTPQVRLQLAAYSLLWSAIKGNKPPQGAVAVELRDDETYRTLWLNKAELRQAEREWLAVLTVYNFMQTHNLKEKPTNGGQIQDRPESQY